MHAELCGELQGHAVGPDTGEVDLVRRLKAERARKRARSLARIDLVRHRKPERKSAAERWAPCAKGVGHFLPHAWSLKRIGRGTGLHGLSSTRRRLGARVRGLYDGF